MNRSEIFTTLVEKRPWTDYEGEKRTNITRATFGNNRKNNGQNVKSRTLELMAKATGFKLIQTNAKKGILPSSAEALFDLIENKNINLNKELENNNSYQVLKKINSLVIINGTNTNVADIQLLMIN